MPTPEAAAPRVCGRTGLVLAASRGQTVFRVAKTKRGPFDPPMREPATPVDELSRWDIPGRTIYAGSAEHGALLEVLSYIEPDDTSAVTMTDVFDDVTADDELFLHEQVAKELPAHGGMTTRSVSRHWREIRNIYEFELPTDGWFVDITASDSIGAVDTQLRTVLATKLRIDELQLSHLAADGADGRAVTTEIARWVHDQVLDDGSRPRGIVYPSKYGSDIANYAVWLRHRDDDADGVDPLRRTGQYAIHRHAKDFQHAVKRLRLRAY